MEIKPVHNQNGVHGDGVNGSPAWSSETNWTISSGALSSSVTFESSGDDNIEAVDSTLPSPLVLKPSSPDSAPCEIKLFFKQKHEIRQIYVRSTARVYEIYYAPSWRAMDEYLCTVRCCIAERDGEILQATNDEDVAQERTKAFLGEFPASKSTSSGSEDDWIKVKDPVSPLHENGISSFPNKADSKEGSSIQDFYEATAEMSDADPCTSITIRLLSLQNKCCVHVDEVYVYADPIDFSDSENQTVQMGSSSGSSLMAMLVPTLLQLSKSGASQVPEKTAPDKLRMNAEVVSKPVDQPYAADGTPHDDKLSAEQQNVTSYDTGAEPALSQLPSHDPSVDKLDDLLITKDIPNSRIEGLLEQLVSRVSRVEDFCSRFEENILKPVKSMEARLSRVEQQLEILAKNSQDSGSPRGTRVSAPSCSCGESSSSSIYDDLIKHPPGISESKNRDISSTDSKLWDDLPITESSPRFLPGLVITAPEFSCGGDDEDGDVSVCPGDALH